MGKNVKLGPNVVLGKNVEVKDGAVIVNSTIMEGTVIAEDCEVRDSIIGWNNRLMAGAKTERTYTGDDVTLKPNVELIDYIVLPNKAVAESNPEVKKVIL